MRLQLSCHGDIDLSQPGMQVEIRSHIARCLRDYPNGGAGEQRWWNVQTENSRSLHDRRLRRTQAAGVRNRCVLRLRRQDRDRLDLEQEGRVGEARDLHQRRGGKRLLVWEVGAAHLAKLRAVRFDVG